MLKFSVEVFKNGEILFDLGTKTIILAGIDGSYWATPVMEVVYKNGETHIIPCYFEDSETVDDSVVEMEKAFAIMTG